MRTTHPVGEARTAAAVLLAVVGAMLGRPAGATPTGQCGHPGERACCALETGFACRPGATEVPGCPYPGDLCECPSGFPTSGRCEAVSACGHAGERACCIGETGYACVPGATEVAGCAGNCFCDNGLGSQSSGSCVEVTPCGGENERACCPAEQIPSCDNGDLFEMPFCAGNCTCNVGGQASGTCVKPKDCGGEGQRACCVAERATRCDAGLVEIAGCSGDCFCALSGEKSDSTCVKMVNRVVGPIAEPEVGWEPPAQPVECKMRGFADLHLHLFGHMAHGGGVLAGKPYDETGGVNEALQACYGTDESLIGYMGGTLPLLDDGSAPECPAYLPDCGARLFHGDHTVFDSPLIVGTNDGAGDTAGLGAPAFNAWPKFNSTIHQQSYFRWLERAWRGGLRLVSMLAVTNEALCRSMRRRYDVDCTDSMASIDLQLDAAAEIEAFIDAQHSGPGTGWFRIVRNATEARQVIREGKLAVMLGIEVDNLFNCKDGSQTCTPAFVQAKVAEYAARGVRHVFPVHNFDNAFGGAATWQDTINVAQAAVEGRWWEIEDCSIEGYGFRLGQPDLTTYNLAFGPLMGGPAAPTAPTYPGTGSTASCNVRGFSDTPADPNAGIGLVLLEAMKAHAMVIDIDHMSRRSITEVMAWSKANRYPLVASHGLFLDQHETEYSGRGGRHERMRTKGQLLAMAANGGMVAAMLKDDVQDTGRKGERVTKTLFSSVKDDCRHSTKSFAQSFLYAADTMKAPVALGSDFNGVAGHVGPRFGSEACGGDGDERSLQARFSDRVEYPFTLPGFGTFHEQVTGQKHFDFNVDGLAHVGLLPDMVADLLAIGMPLDALDKLYRSAEGFVELWEKAEVAAGMPVRRDCNDITVVAGPECSATATLAHPSIQGDPNAVVTLSPTPEYDLGDTKVTMTVSFADKCENSFTCSGIITVVDQTPPAIHCPADLTVPCPDAGGATVTYADPTIEADNCGGEELVGCDIASGSEFAAGTTPVTCQATDTAGNLSSCTFQVEVACERPAEADAGTAEEADAGGLTLPPLTGCNCDQAGGLVWLLGLVGLRRRRGGAPVGG